MLTPSLKHEKQLLTLESGGEKHCHRHTLRMKRGTVLTQRPFLALWPTVKTMMEKEKGGGEQRKTSPSTHD